MACKLVILDYNTSEVHIFSISQGVLDTQAIEEHISTLYSEHGETFKLDQIEWMVVDTESNEGRLPIYIH